MSTYTITKKNQVTIPVSIMNFLGIKPGEKIQYLVDKKGRVAIANPSQSIKKARGSVILPKRFANKDLSQIIENAKKEYFQSKN